MEFSLRFLNNQKVQVQSMWLQVLWALSMEFYQHKYQSPPRIISFNQIAFAKTAQNKATPGCFNSLVFVS